MYFTSSIGDAIRIPLRLTLSVLSCFSLGVVQLTGAAPTTKPSITAEQYLGLDLQTPKIFSPPPTAKSAGASSPANPITLRSTWLRQRGCTLVASLFYSTCYIYCPLSTRSNGKYDCFILLYEKQWGTRQLSYPWWTLLNAIIIYLCAFELCICRWAWELS